MPKIAIIADFLEEKWPSMDLSAEELASHLPAIEGIESELVRPPLRTVRSGRPATGLERALGRFLQLPLELKLRRIEADYYHIADHSYAHLALLFPSERVGIYCHDIDAFRALLPGSKASRPRKFLSQLLLKGLRHARVVFHSTQGVREEILQHALVPAERLVQAPLGVAAEYLRVTAGDPPSRPYMLHVGSCIPRKNIELLLRVFAATRRHNTHLNLIQVGGSWTDAHRAYLDEQGLNPYVTQMRGLSREELAKLYANAEVVLVPSLAEGFGIPVIEALACGAPVIANDIPILREVAFQGARFCPAADVEAWTNTIQEQLATGSRVSQEIRERVQNRYSWNAHANAIWSGYEPNPPPAGTPSL